MLGFAYVYIHFLGVPCANLSNEDKALWVAAFGQGQLSHAYLHCQAVLNERIESAMLLVRIHGYR